MMGYEDCPECAGQLKFTQTPSACIWWCDNYNCPGFEAYHMEELV